MAAIPHTTPTSQPAAHLRPEKARQGVVSGRIVTILAVSVALTLVAMVVLLMADF